MARAFFASAKRKEEATMKDDFFKKYRRRAVRRGWAMSAIIGLIISFAAVIVAAVLIYMLGAENLYWVLFAVFGGCMAVSLPLLYFLKYRPDDKDVARAVDALGMEERYITMMELEGSSSFMAKKQREDTYSALQSVPPKAIKVAVTTLMLVLLIVFGAVAVGGTVVVALADAGYVPGFGEVVDTIFSGDDAVRYEVRYAVYDETDTYRVNGRAEPVGDGIINGDTDQSIAEGGNCTTVYAEAVADSVFCMWSDGKTNPERTDKDIREDTTIYAIFLAVDDDEYDIGDESREDTEGDNSEMGEAASENDAGGLTSDTPGDGGDGEKDDDETGGSGSAAGSAAGSKTDKRNDSVYDGDTDPSGELPDASEDASDDFNSGRHSDKEIEMGGDYFDRIK